VIINTPTAPTRGLDEKAIRRAAVTARLRPSQHCRPTGSREGMRRLQRGEVRVQGTPASARRAGGGEAAVSVSSSLRNDGSVGTQSAAAGGDIRLRAFYPLTCFCTGDPRRYSDSADTGLGGIKYQISECAAAAPKGSINLSVWIAMHGTNLVAFAGRLGR